MIPEVGDEVSYQIGEQKVVIGMITKDYGNGYLEFEWREMKQYRDGQPPRMVKKSKSVQARHCTIIAKQQKLELPPIGGEEK